MQREYGQNFDKSFTFHGFKWMGKKAKKHGINISMICRHALKGALEQVMTESSKSKPTAMKKKARRRATK